MENNIIKQLDIFFKSDKIKYLNFIIFLLSLANLQTLHNDDNPSHFFKDIIDNFNNKIDDLSLEKDLSLQNKLYTILSMIENYSAIPKEYKINTSLFNDSKLFYEKYLKDIINKNIYLTRFQQQLFIDCLDEKTNYLFGMPTSFGKSFVIRLVAMYRANQNKRTIICIPTLALLNEYRIELNKINKLKNFEISSNPLFNSEFKILISTQERLIDFKIKPNDLLIVDESYTIDDENLRGAILKSLTKNFLKENNAVKLFQPNIIRIDEKSFPIENKFTTKIINYSFCSQKEMDKENKKNIDDNVMQIVKNSYDKKEKIGIFALKTKHIKYATKIDENMTINENFKEEKWFKLLQEIYTKHYLPIYFLSKGILINNGELPKFFRFISENVFKNNNKMYILICNNTLTKGINFSLKNIIIQSKNGISDKEGINEFELKNLIGRVGRYSLNNINDRLGKFYIVLSSKKFSENIKKIKDKNKVNYKPEKDKIESEKYNKWLDIINNGTFEPWKYILEKFNGNESLFKEFIFRHADCIKEYYSTKNNKNDFYNFIIDLFGGEEEYIKRFFNNKYSDHDIKSDIQKNYLIQRTKNQIFKHVFENYPIKDLVSKEYEYFFKNEYFYNKETGETSKQEYKNINTKISSVKYGDENYRLIFTWMINKLSNEINSFYSGNFTLIEPKIIATIKEKFPDFKPNNEYSELDIVMDKYNLPRDFREHLIKKNIKNEEELKNSEEFKIINEISSK